MSRHTQPGKTPRRPADRAESNGLRMPRHTQPDRTPQPTSKPGRNRRVTLAHTYTTRQCAPPTSRPGRIQRVAHAGTYATGCFIAWDGTTLLSGYTPRVITRHTTGHTAHRSTPQLSTAHRDARPHNTHRIALHHGAPRHITPHHATPQHNTTQRITANSAHASYRLRSAAGNTKCMFSLTVST